MLFIFNLSSFDGLSVLLEFPNFAARKTHAQEILNFNGLTCVCVVCVFVYNIYVCIYISLFC